MVKHYGLKWVQSLGFNVTNAGENVRNPASSDEIKLLMSSSFAFLANKFFDSVRVALLPPTPTLGFYRVQY